MQIVVTRFWKWGTGRKTEQGEYNFRKKEERKKERKVEGREKIQKRKKKSMRAKKI